MVSIIRRKGGYQRQLLTATEKLSLNQWILHRLHALLGVYVLCHFIYRYIRFFSSVLSSVTSYQQDHANKQYDDDDDMGFNYHHHHHHHQNNTNNQTLQQQGQEEEQVQVIHNIITELLHPTTTIQFIVLFLPHLLLQMSGFLFHIPKHRHPDGNRIWPEYRYHALIFFCRSLLLLYLAWLTPSSSSSVTSSSSSTLMLNRDYPIRYLINLSIVLGTSSIADYVTYYYQCKNESSSTIRQLNGPKSILYLMSVIQFHATVQCLWTGQYGSVQVAAMTVVQTSAFGMTLRRKGMITLAQGLVLYSFILVLGLCVIYYDLQHHHHYDSYPYESSSSSHYYQQQQQQQHSGTIKFYQAIVFGNLAALLRINLGWNKYILWPIITMCLIGVTPSSSSSSSSAFQTSTTFTTATTMTTFVGWSSSWWIYGAIGSTFTILGSAIQRQVVVVKPKVNINKTQ